MWLKHFAWREDEKKFQDFVTRYWAFSEADISRICVDCHEAIHAIYFTIICRWAHKHGKCKDWTWEQAEALMKALKNRYKLWISGKVRSRKKKSKTIV